MPSATIGQASCPECSGVALVKLSDRPGAKAFRWCTVCGAQYFTKNGAQDEALRAKMQPLAAIAPEPILPAGEPVTPERGIGPAPAAPRPAPTPAGAERGLFSSIFRAS